MPNDTCSSTSSNSGSTKWVSKYGYDGLIKDTPESRAKMASIFSQMQSHERRSSGPIYVNSYGTSSCSTYSQNCNPCVSSCPGGVCSMSMSMSEHSSRGSTTPP